MGLTDIAIAAGVGVAVVGALAWWFMRNPIDNSEPLFVDISFELQLLADKLGLRYDDRDDHRIAKGRLQGYTVRAWVRIQRVDYHDEAMGFMIRSRRFNRLGRQRIDDVQVDDEVHLEVSGPVDVNLAGSVLSLPDLQVNAHFVRWARHRPGHKTMMQDLQQVVGVLASQ